MPLKCVRNSQGIVYAAFPADAIRFLLLVFSNLHQTSSLKFHRVGLYVPAIHGNAATTARIEI
jgi:hypothetical protein